MTYDELETLVLDGGDGAALQRALAPLDEKARAKLSSPAQKLYRQLHTSKAAQGASDRLARLLNARAGAPWQHWNAVETRLAILALFALGPVSVLKKREVHVWTEHMPALDGIIRDRRPEWLDDWVLHQLDREFTYLGFEMLRAWIRDGLCAKPDADGYYRMFAAHMMRTGMYHQGEVVPPITRQLLADPELLGDVQGLFRVETIAFNTNGWLQKGAASDYETWTDALVKLAAEGHLDRSELLQQALDGLRLDLKQNQLSGFHGFYRLMKPDAAEMLRHQTGYADLLCHPVGHVVKFAIDMLGEVEKQGALDVEPLLRELPVVFAGDAKGNALAALKLLKRIVAQHPRYAGQALAVAGEALRHTHMDVQSAALDLLAANAARIADEDRAALADMEPFVAASNRARFAQLFAIKPEQPVGAVAARPTEPLREAPASLDYQPIPGDRIEGPILHSEEAIAPIETVDALIDAVLHAIEEVDSPDEIERIVDAISRLGPSRPADFEARVAPLRHRLNSTWGLKGIVVSTAGVGGALLDLLNTWLTGTLHRTPSEDSKFHKLEDGFVPVTAHLRTIIDRIDRGETHALISTPTHKGGWIDPLVWVRRLQQADRGIVDSMDFRLSLLRLAPDHRAEARDMAKVLSAPLGPVVDFALGGNARPTKADRRYDAAWLTAARCRDPFRDWSDELAPLDPDPQLPDGVLPARYVWQSSHKPGEYHDLRWKVPELTIAVCCAGDDTPWTAEKPAGLVGKIGAVLNLRTAIDWSALPAVALNRRIETDHCWSGELNAPWVAQWLAQVWPQNPGAFGLHAVTRLLQRTDENASGWNPSHGFFQPLFQRGRPWREPGHLLLCLGLVGKDADARGLAIDALIEGIDARLFDPGQFAATIVRLTAGEWVKLNRLGDTLMQVIQVSPLHAAVVSDALQHWLPKLDLQQKNAFRLLEVLVEAQALTGRPLGEQARRALGEASATGKAAKIAKQLAA